MAMSVPMLISLLMLFLQRYCIVVKAQEVENFTCVFSECAGEDIVCNCSVPDDPLFWWDGNSGFCSITILHDSNPTRDEPNVVAEVVDTSPSGGFTSKLTRRNISTGLNGTKIGCSPSLIDRVTCRPSRTDQIYSFTLFVQSCQAPNPPMNFSLVMTQDAHCNSTMRMVTLTWRAPEPALSQFPVTNYNIMYASGEGDSHSETVPADTTSYNLPVVAGVQYTITVSALSNGRESQNNPQLNFGASFCSDTTPSTSSGTETTTAGNSSTPTSEGIQTTSTPNTDHGSIIGGSIGGIAVLISIFIIGLLCYCYIKKDNVCHGGHYYPKREEHKEASRREKEGEENRATN